MNVLTIFEQRVGAIFAENAPSEKKPISFKRLAKRAVREMEDETFVIDGVDTAPALYTILVSAQDDVVMRPMYVLITDEIAQLIEAQAKKRGYTFVGRPLVRFMVDPALRHGKCSVFAENIDPRTLARLRDEENAFLGVAPAYEPYVAQSFVVEPAPAVSQQAPHAAEDLFAVEAGHDQADANGLPDLLVSDEDEVPVPTDEAADENGMRPVEIEDEQPVALSEPNEEPEAEDDQVIEDELEEAMSEIALASSSVSEAEPAAVVPPLIAGASTPAAESAPIPEKPGRTSSIPKISMPEDEPAEAPVPARPACTLTDLATGQEYRLTEARFVVGRERTAGAVVLTDPNVSRRHAEFSFEGGAWHVRDLNSTNGTLVNNIDLPTATLQDGDVVTLGITDLQFRAG